MTPLDRKIIAVRMTSLIGVIGAACFLASNIIVNLLQPEFDPANTFVSDLVWGRVGWLMTASFIMHGLSILALAFALHLGIVRGRTQIWASRLMLLGGSGVFLLGFFPTDPIGNGPLSWVGAMHLGLAATAFGALVVAFLLFSHSFSHDAHWGRAQTASTALGIMGAVTYVVFLAIVAIGEVRSEVHVVQGMTERILIAVILTWMLVVALRLRRVACDPEHFVESEEGIRVH